VLILIIADQMCNDWLCCSYKKQTEIYVESFVKYMHSAFNNLDKFV